jgi:hypothetical protein
VAKDTKLSDPEVKPIVEQTTELALGVVDTYFDFLLKTISSYPSGGTDMGEKLKSYAANNIAATHEFVRRLSQAKDYQDAVRIQRQFTQAQMKAFSEQTKLFGEEVTKAATGAVKASAFQNVSLIRRRF